MWWLGGTSGGSVGVLDTGQGLCLYAVLWSYGPSLAVDGREETCSYTTSAGEGRWWRVRLSSITSVGQVSLTLASPPHQVVVYLGTGKDLTHCHPLQAAEATGDTDRYRVVTDCTGMKGDSLMVKDLRSADDYFGVCEVQIFRFQEVLSCGVPDSPRQGEVVVTGGGHTAHYSCAEGHTLQGEHQVQCGEGGWEGSLTPRCQAVTCPHPAPTDHGYIQVTPFTGQYTLGTTARYLCSPGYSLKGDESRVCTIQGWTGELPQCQQVHCGEPPSVPNSDMAELDLSVVTFTCLPGYTTGDPTVTEFQSSCGTSGNWSSVTHHCRQNLSGYQFGEDPRKDFLLIIITGIFVIIAVSSMALATRMIISRIQTKRGFFLRNPTYQSTSSRPPETVESVKPLGSEISPIIPSPISPVKDSTKGKKVSLILKIEEERRAGQGRKHSVVGDHSPALLPRAAIRFNPAVTESCDSSPVKKTRSVQLCVMSHSSSSLPLPESNITMLSTNFATLSRRGRREKTELGNIRHSRTFSTFQPVKVPRVGLTGSESGSGAAMNSVTV